MHGRGLLARLTWSCLWQIFEITENEKFIYPGLVAQMITFTLVYPSWIEFSSFTFYEQIYEKRANEPPSPLYIYSWYSPRCIAIVYRPARWWGIFPLVFGFAVLLLTFIYNKPTLNPTLTLTLTLLINDPNSDLITGFHASEDRSNKVIDSKK